MQTWWEDSHLHAKETGLRGTHPDVRLQPPGPRKYTVAKATQSVALGYLSPRKLLCWGQSDVAALSLPPSCLRGSLGPRAGHLAGVA